MQVVQGLEYEESGSGEPVLLIHGALVADAFAPLMRESALADRHRLIRYRRRGHGRSERLADAFSLAQQAQDAAALLTALGVERAHVVGHSGGGAIALQLALDEPKRVHSMVLLEPAVFPAAAVAAVSEMTAPVLEAFRAGDVDEALDLWMRAVDAADWRTAAASLVPGAAEQAAQDASTFFERELPTLGDWVFEVERTIRVRQPVLYLLGGESGLRFQAAALHFRSLVRQTESKVVPGVNHLMQLRDPKLVAEATADFLSRHPMR
jgi:pimeloyl-ACP methyl ester carboxylesterase